MTAQDLIAAFETLAEAPEGVKRLRELVLQLAVRGKLVAQDEADEPAGALLTRVAEQRDRLVSNGRIRRDATLPVASPGDLDFPTPDSWEVSRLGFLAAVLDHLREPVKAEDREARCAGRPREALFPYYGATQQQGWIDAYRLEGEFVLLGEDGVPFLQPGRPKAYLVSGQIWVNNHAHVLEGVCMSNSFLLHYLNVFDYSGRVTGTTRPKLTKGDLLDIPVPVPPLAEQHRIVARVDELMGLLDRLETARHAREATRTALRDAALAALRTADTPEEVELAWQRVAEGMHDLFTDPADVNPLRQAVLQLAVRGKLVPQNPAEPVLPGEAPEGPFAVPDGWTWSTLGGLTSLITSGSRSWNQYYAEAGATFIRSQDIKFDRLEYDKRAYVNIPEGSEGTRTQVGIGDLLITITGANVGKCAHLCEDVGEAYVSQHVALIRPKDPDISAFGHLWLTADHGGRGLLLDSSYGAKPGLNLTQLRSLPIPLPPKAEQHRIVAKVDQLMTLLDQLEQRLTTQRETHDTFAAAAVHHLDA